MTSWGDFEARDAYFYDAMSGVLVEGKLFAGCAFCDREYCVELRRATIERVNRGDMRLFRQQQRWLALDVLEHCMSEHADECFGEADMQWRRPVLSQLEEELMREWFSRDGARGPAAER